MNLRGGREHGSWQFQKDICDRLGHHACRIRGRSRGAPDRDTILSAKAFFDELAYPAIMHCKSGADRAGFVAVLYLIVHEGRTVDEAMRQLSARFGHFRFSKTGILDAFFDRYRRDGEAKGIPFLTWVETIYDPEALEREFPTRLLVERPRRPDHAAGVAAEGVGSASWDNCRR